MKSPSHILIVEDDRPFGAMLEQTLASEGYEVVRVTRGDEGLRHVGRRAFSAVISDLKLPGLSGLDLIRKIHEIRPALPVILMTAYGTTDAAIQSAKLGAFDYLIKPFETTVLLDMIRKAVASYRTAEKSIPPPLPDQPHPLLVGNSARMRAVCKEIGRVAAKPVTVLIRGATGTGKELVARAIHQYSDRHQQPFVTVNCTAIPENVLENALFGCDGEAAAGAQRIGCFEQANRGTIFLNEVADMSLRTQARLLRVLQEKTVQRPGGEAVIPVDVRVIAATSRPLEKAIQKRQFREDLYYRLSVYIIHLPNLRERREDIASLALYFLRWHAPRLGFENTSIDTEALHLLQEQPWPGNVRELENVVNRAILLARGCIITAETIYSCLNSANQPSEKPPFAGYVADLLREAGDGKLKNIRHTLTAAVERELYSQAIQRAQGNQVRAAKWLGVSRPTMHAKLVRYGLLATDRSSSEEEGG